LNARHIVDIGGAGKANLVGGHTPCLPPRGRGSDPCRWTG
jgi:hypothetical protein